ncbi:Hsp70 family protein [Kocuria palustris]|nr:Hsp70 family protein [Kocuria palustris]
MSAVIGIDITDKRILVSWRNNSYFYTVTNDAGETSTPSWVAFIGNKTLVGAAAVRQFELNPANTVFCFEKLLGRKYSDPDLQALLQQLPYKVVNDLADPEKIFVEVEHGGGVKQYTPVEIYSILFQSVSYNIKRFTGLNFTDAGVAVPDHFTGPQRQAIVDAAAMAGFNAHIIDASAAAVLAIADDIM